MFYNDIGFATAYCRIYCDKSLTTSNQTSCYISNASYFSKSGRSVVRALASDTKGHNFEPEKLL